MTSPKKKIDWFDVTMAFLLVILVVTVVLTAFAETLSIKYRRAYENDCALRGGVTVVDVNNSYLCVDKKAIMK